MSVERRKVVQPKTYSRAIYPLPLYKPTAIRTDRKWVLALQRTNRHWLKAESRWIKDTMANWFCWADLPANLAAHPRPRIFQPLHPQYRLRLLELELHFAPETPAEGSSDPVLVLGHLDPEAHLDLPSRVTLHEPFLWWAQLPPNKHAARYQQLSREADQKAYIAEQEEKAARRAARAAREEVA